MIVLQSWTKSLEQSKETKEYWAGSENFLNNVIGSQSTPGSFIWKFYKNCSMGNCLIFKIFWKFRFFFIWKFRKIFKFQNFLQIFFQNFHIFDFYLIFTLSLLTINYITCMIVIKQDPLLVLGPVRPFRCIIRALPVGVLLIVVYISHFHQFHKNRSFHLLWLEGTVYM